MTSDYRRRLRAFEETSPGANPQSLSERAKRLVQERPDDYPVMIRAMREKSHDRDAFMHNLVENKEAGRALLLEAAKLSNAIVGTPVALQQFANRMD